MVRHGQADAAWHESPDPGLSELGQQQAATAAQQLDHLNNIAIISGGPFLGGPLQNMICGWPLQRFVALTWQILCG